MQLTLIQSGFFYCTGGAMFGVIPQKIWRKRYPAYGEMCRLSTNMLYVEMGSRKIVVDAGTGVKYPERCKSYGFENVINPAVALSSLGVPSDEVTDVILTHLHFDHCGGCTGTDKNGVLNVTFPKAIHWVSRKQWEHAQNPTLLDEDAYWPENVSPLEDAGLICLVEQDSEIYPGVKLELYNGHTPGQIVPVFELNGLRYCFTGDVIPTSAHLSTLWISAYDIYPVDSVNEKLRLLNNAVVDNRILITSHDTEALAFTIRKMSDYYKLKNEIAIRLCKI
ncbi:MBL fold metallo-hydrolase [Parabacteroides sp. FAFU027]|uniref:MBL fold metallo-hydrolase n=1 Tax=Parabacteroides sp. FAFU027 TaxID=2922715 RepID=UPI001FAF02F9|nr:MBL fold metallo-hydrolase [Parabacteroides sp. FAFU027]